jgi:hypothetical protein
VTVILGLDPGLSTGFSIWHYDAITPPQPLEHGTITGGHRGLANWWRDRLDANEGALQWDEVVSESFIPDGRTAFPEIDPLRSEGVLYALFPSVVFQRNLYKAHVTDEKIKELGLWWPGSGHDRDSLRHVFAYLKTRGHVPTQMLWKRPKQAIEFTPAGGTGF